MVNYNEQARAARIEILGLIHRAQTSHIASNFSVIDIATVLYENVDLALDRVVWSKGWVAATIYYFLHKKGIITDAQLAQFPNDPMFGLAETTVPGVEVNGGSVGHGLSFAVGSALAKKRAGEEGTVYCIMSDGELNEGSVWEAALMAGHHKLDNLVAIIDNNKWQAMGRSKDVAHFDMTMVFRGFGWSIEEINGHNFDDIATSLKSKNDIDSPKAIIADTVKGKGVSFMEDHLVFHYKNVDDETYQKALTELQHA